MNMSVNSIFSKICTKAKFETFCWDRYYICIEIINDGHFLSNLSWSARKGNLGLYCLPRFWTVTWSWGTRFSQLLCCCYSTAPPPRGMPVTTSPQTTPCGTWSPTPASPGWPLYWSYFIRWVGVYYRWSLFKGTDKTMCLLFKFFWMPL